MIRFAIATAQFIICLASCLYLAATGVIDPRIASGFITGCLVGMIISEMALLSYFLLKPDPRKDDEKG